MVKNISFLILAYIIPMGSKAQLIIDNATLNIGAGATVKVTGDVTSNADIQGTGLLLLQGTALQKIDMGGRTIPNLELDNIANATFSNSNVKIGTGLNLTNGKIIAGNFNLILAPPASITGASSSRFISINGTGQLIKQLYADVAGFEFPVGDNSNYRPGYLTTTGCSYTSAEFGLQVSGNSDENKPPMISNYLNVKWLFTNTGITGGTVMLSGQYIDPADVSGSKMNLVGYFRNGTDWTSAGETHDASLNRVGVPVTGTSAGVVTGFNKFITVGAKAFLQGAYVSSTGLMNDNLRSLPFGPASSTANFPQDDPYRTAAYISEFPHVNNPITEAIPNSSVVATQPDINNNIVDWVFLQLRDLSPSPGNTILQTRSALLQKDGDIVDVDGASPVTFNGIADGNYILTIRHRNHLGLSLNQASPRLLTETKSLAYDPSRVFDFRTVSGTQLFGTSAAYTTASHPSLTTVNLLWGGNANRNTKTQYSGLNNDRDYLLISILGNNPSFFLNNIYHTADINLNKAVRYSGLNNDRDYLLINILGNNPSSSRTQAIPN